MSERFFLDAMEEYISLVGGYFRTVLIGEYLDGILSTDDMEDTITTYRESETTNGEATHYSIDVTFGEEAE